MMTTTFEKFTTSNFTIFEYAYRKRRGPL